MIRLVGQQDIKGRVEKKMRRWYNADVERINETPVQRVIVKGQDFAKQYCHNFSTYGYRVV